MKRVIQSLGLVLVGVAISVGGKALADNAVIGTTFTVSSPGQPTVVMQTPPQAPPETPPADPEVPVTPSTCQ